MSERVARGLGVLLQVALFGSLLAVALLELLVVAGADRVFRYQGF